MKNESLIVFTHRSTEFLTKLNASTSWSLNPSRAMNCEYVICTRNANNPLTDRNDDIPHGAAFFVGKISNVVQSLNLPRDNRRYMVEFDQYAEILIENFWGGWRSPVKYIDNQELMYINFEELDWEPVPERDINWISDYFDVENKHYESREKVSTIIREVRQEEEEAREEEEVVKKEKIFKESISIAEAKQGLSKYYGTPEENIEIIIRG